MTSVSFDTITSGIRTNTNHAEFDTSREVVGVQDRPTKILLMGIRLTTGTVAELTPKQILSGAQAEGYFGVGSQLAEMCRIAKRNNSQTEMWACAINENASGTKGTKTITVTGTAGATKSINLYIEGGFYIPVSVTSGDAQNAMAAAINTAIQGHAQYARMPFVSTVATNVVTLTMKWKGVEVADARVNYNAGDDDVPGVTLTIANGVSGAGNPDVNSILGAIGDVTWFDKIANPWTDATNLTALEQELLDRWGGMRQIDGVAFAASVGSHGTASTLGASRNSAFTVIMGANLSPSPSWLWAAAACAAVAGQSGDPALPLQTVPLLGIYPAQSKDQWGDADRNLLLHTGIATHRVDASGLVTLERMVTTYQRNAQGVLDTSLLDLETVLTASAIRYDGNTSIALRYARYKLAKDPVNGQQLPPGQPILTPAGMKGFLAGRYDIWASEGWVEIGSKQQFLDELICDIDPSDVNRLVCQAGPDFVNQFRGISIKWSFIV